MNNQQKHQESQPQQAQQQQPQKIQMSFPTQPETAFRNQPTMAGNPVLTQEQYEALKRHHSQAQAARQKNVAGAPAAAAVGDTTGGATDKAGAAPQQPYMVLTQVTVPAHMLGQLAKNNPNQLQQLLLQQQHGSGNASSMGSQPQILSFGQLPPQMQQQILLQQRQLQPQKQGSNSASQQQPQQVQTQQPQVWQPVQKQPPQPQQAPVPQPTKASEGALTMDDIQDLLKNNQLDASVVQQLLASQMNKATNSSSSTSQNQNNSAAATTETSLSELLHSFNAAASQGDTDISNTHTKMFLETQVQPVQRQNDTCTDDDLFKFFEVEHLLGEEGTTSVGEDFLNPSTSTAKKLNEMMPSQFQNLSSFLEPTPMLQQTAATDVQQAQMTSANDQQQQVIQSQHQLQGQPQHLHIPATSQLPSQSQKPRPGGIHSQGPAPAVVRSQASAPVNPAFSLPSTVVPPTVLASVCTGKAAKRAEGKKKAPPSKRAKRVDTPQDVLMKLVERQGHPDLKRIKSEDAGYDTMPSPLQLSSFGTQVVHAVHTSDADMLGRLLSCGLSANPCNQFRDSILDLVCKRNNVAIFKCLLEHGTELRVVDGFGRTPLHHCAWASSFSREIAEAIVERDPLQLFIEDKRGQTPMEYVRSDIMSEWSEFLEEMADKFWPKGGVAPKLIRPKGHRPDGTLPDPKNAVSAGLASMISSGNITVEQFEKMDEKTKASFK